MVAWSVGLSTRGKMDISHFTFILNIFIVLDNLQQRVNWYYACSCYPRLVTEIGRVSGLYQ